MTFATLRTIGLLCAATWLSACTPARRKVSGDIVRSLHFDGNGSFFSGHNDYQLQGAMRQSDSSFGVATFPLNYLSKPVVLDRDTLAVDAYRLETWYAQNGWFDARFTGWQIHQIRRQSFKRAGMVRVLGTVETGTPSMVREFRFTGSSGAATRVFTSTVRRTGSLQEGSQFSLDAVEVTRAELLNLFSNDGYPYATVDTAVEAYPEDHAVDVIFEVDSGIAAKLGEITVSGSQAIDSRIVLETLPFKTGDTYDAQVLRSGQQRLFALGTYAIVNIEPDLSDPAQADVPVHIKLTETRFQTLRAGGGADYNGSLLTPRVSLQYRHVHLFNRLIQTKLGGSIGYAFDITGDQPPDTPYTFDLNASLSTPRLAGPRWGLAANVSLVQDVLPAQYAYINPKTSLRLTHRFTDSVSLDMGPTLQYYQILGDDNGGLLARSLFGADFEGSYRLGTMDIGFTADWRDDPLDTTRGTYYRVGLRQAIPLVSRSSGARRYVFSDIGGEARTYRRIRTKGSPFTLAMRARGRVMLSESRDDDGEQVGIPYPERLFQGGSADLRGFRINHVGAYDTVCTYAKDTTPGRVSNPFLGTPNADNELFRRYLPVGGETDALLSAEARFRLPYGLSFVPFVDSGILSPSISQLNSDQIRVAGGIGIRYASVVGPIRVDLAVRPLYAEDRSPRAILGCEGDDSQPRGIDLISSVSNQVGAARTIPFALNLIITIGQAF